MYISQQQTRPESLKEEFEELIANNPDILRQQAEELVQQNPSYKMLLAQEVQEKAYEQCLAQYIDERTSQLRDTAYDLARKEFYKLRLQEDVERDVAREEALHYNAQFAPSENEKAIEKEDDAMDAWRTWALQDLESAKQKLSAMYTGAGIGDNAEAIESSIETLDVDGAETGLSPTPPTTNKTMR